MVDEERKEIYNGLDMEERRMMMGEYKSEENWRQAYNAVMPKYLEALGYIYKESSVEDFPKAFKQIHVDAGYGKKSEDK